MERALFRSRFLTAAAAARDFARGYVEEALPDDCRFHLHLNQSYDGSAGPEYKRFPEDSAAELAVRLKHLTPDEVIDTLWRDGMVPQWVNLSVVGDTGAATVVEVITCGRFTADESRLYHVEEGYAPFHVLGPALPVDHEEGRPFSIHSRSTCWTETDLRRAQEHASKVWSLEINGPAFTDETLARGLNFPSLELLDVHATRAGGSWLRAIVGAPRLRVLRVTCGEAGVFDVSLLPSASGVKTVSFDNLPAEFVGVKRIAGAFPNLADLALGAAGNVRADGELAVAGLTHLSLSFPATQSWVRGAPGAARIDLHYDNASGEEVSKALRSAAETVTEVGLRGTPVTDAIFATLADLPKLTYVDLVDTKVSVEAVAEFVRNRPGLRYFPRPQ